MSFAIDLYSNTEPYNKILKSPTRILETSGELKEECSLIDPEVIIEYAGTLTGVNYAHIPEFGRYYFIKNIESYRTNLWRVTLHCDVLFSFSAGILSSPAIAARSSNNFNMMLNDDHYYTQENPMIFTKAFPSGFNTAQASYVLALIGQAATGE